MEKKRSKNPGYQLPTEIDPPQVSICVCVPCDPNHAQAFLGQLEHLSRWWAWQKDPLKQGKDAALVWQGIADDARKQLEDCGVFDMGCGCDDKPEPRYRFDEDGNVEVSDDNGLTWESNEENDPRINPVVIFPALPGADGSDKKCVAANSITTGFQELFDKELAALVDGNDLITSLYAIVTAFIVFVIGVPLVGIPAFLVVLFGVVVQWFARQIPEEMEAAFTEDTWQQFLCAIYCNLETDGTMTAGGYSGALALIEANVEGETPKEFFRRHMGLLLEGGLSNLGRAGYGGSRSCDECPCGEEWCYRFDFTVGQQGWVLNTDPVNFGRYVAATGFMQSTSYSSVDAIECESPTFNRALTSIRFIFSEIFSGPVARVAVFMNHYGLDVGEGDDVGIDIIKTIEPAVFMNTVSFDLDPHVGAQTFWGGALIAIELRGLGTNPFGEDNCEEE